MGELRRKADWPIVAALVLAVVAMPLTVYVAGYLAMSNSGTISTRYQTKMCRFYSTQWQADAFWPAARVESFFLRREVVTGQMPPY